MGVVGRARRNRHVLCLMLHHCNNNYFVRCPLPSSFVWLAADRPGRMLARDGCEHGDGRCGSSYLIASAQRSGRDNEDVGDAAAAGNITCRLVWFGCASQPPHARAKCFSNTFSSQPFSKQAILLLLRSRAFRRSCKVPAFSAERASHLCVCAIEKCTKDDLCVCAIEKCTKDAPILWPSEKERKVVSESRRQASGLQRPQRL